MALETQNTLEGHAALLENIDGTRITLMDYAEVPEGWVVDAKKGSPLWEYMNPEVFPLKPKPGFLGIVPKSAREAQKELDSMRGDLEDAEAFMVVIPDGDGGWSMEWLRPTDLRAFDVDGLFTDSLAMIGKNMDLSMAMETAYKVRKAEWDLT